MVWIHAAWGCPFMGRGVRFKQQDRRCAVSKKWSGRPDSNRRHRPWQGRTLPAELLPLGGYETVYILALRRVIVNRTTQYRMLCFGLTALVFHSENEAFHSYYYYPKTGDCSRVSNRKQPMLQMFHQFNFVCNTMKTKLQKMG